MYDAYLSNTRTTINFAHPERNEFYEDGDVIYVLRMVRTGKLRACASAGFFSGRLAQIGGAVTTAGDQSGRYTGMAHVVAIIPGEYHRQRDHVIQGEVPTETIPYYVFK